MKKIFTTVLLLGGVLIVFPIQADNPPDMQKLDTLLKKEAPASAPSLNLEGGDMGPYDFTSGIGQEFVGANMKGTNFAGKKLKKIEFNKVNFEGANFEGANLTSVSFKDCNLTNANFKNAKLLYGGFRDSNLSNVKFGGAKFESVGFTQVKMGGADFDKADLFRVSMVDVEKDGVSFGSATTRDCSGIGWFS